MHQTTLFVPDRSIYKNMKNHDIPMGQKVKGVFQPLGFIDDRLYFLFHRRRRQFVFLFPINFFNICSFQINHEDSWSTVFDQSLSYRSNLLHVPAVGLSHMEILVIHGDGQDRMILLRINRETKQKCQYRLSDFPAGLNLTHVKLFQHNYDWYGVSFACPEESEKLQFRNVHVWRLSFDESDECCTMTTIFTAPDYLFYESDNDDDDDDTILRFNLNPLSYNGMIILGHRIQSQTSVETVVISDSGQLTVMPLDDRYSIPGRGKKLPLSMAIFNHHLILFSIKFGFQDEFMTAKFYICNVYFSAEQKVQISLWFRFPEKYFLPNHSLFLSILSSPNQELISFCYERDIIKLRKSHRFHFMRIFQGSPNVTEPPSLLQLTKRKCFSKANRGHMNAWLLQNDFYRNLINHICGPSI